MGWRYSAVLITVVCSSHCIAVSDLFAADKSHSFGTLFNQESNKDKKKKEPSKVRAGVPNAIQTFGTLLDPAKKNKEAVKEQNLSKSSKGFGALINPKPGAKAAAKKEEEKSDLLKSILGALQAIPKLVESDTANNQKAIPDKIERAKSNSRPQGVDMAGGADMVPVMDVAEGFVKRKPSVELGFGTGWDYAEGNDEVGNLDITKLSRAYAEGYVRWWGPFGILGPDFGAEAYYFTPTIFRPKICGNNPCSDILDIRVNYFSAALLYRLVRPEITVVPLVGYLLYNFQIPTSQQFVVNHSFEGVSLGAKIEFPFRAPVNMLSFIGAGIASVGDYHEDPGRVTPTPGRLLHATALHADLGFRWKYKKGVFFDLVWQNDSFWYDFARGTARSSYWNIGGRIAVSLPFFSVDQSPGNWIKAQGE